MKLRPTTLWGGLAWGALQILDAAPSPGFAHVTNTFQFQVDAPSSRLAPLFGPEGERAWAGEQWNPEFFHPLPGKDIEGAVFQVRHGTQQHIWVNTRFDLQAGKMQYVSFVDGMIVTVVDVSLIINGASTTNVVVTYSRTALQIEANEDVKNLGRRDKKSGPDWRQGIMKCLGLEEK